MPLVYDAIEERISTAIQKSRDSLLIVCPYIKIAPLQRILSAIPPGVDVEIITTWKLGNFATGVSDVEIFKFCQANKFNLRANNRIHLKTWLIDQKHLIGTSANISNSALGMAAMPNYEFLADTTASPYDLITFNHIRAESVEITAQIFDNTVAILGDTELDDVNEIDLLCSNCFENRVEHIPRCSCPEQLYQYYCSSDSGLSEDALHDLEYLRIPPGLARDSFFAALKKAFFRLPIVERVCERLLEAPMFFGQMKEFLQDVNDSDPKPTRRALTPITQNLYRWMVALNPDVFVVDQPNHSERITIIRQNNVL